MSGDYHAKETIGLVHTNLCGPIARTFHGGAKYFKETFYYTIKTKFGDYIGKKIKAIKYNGGGEYNSKNFNAFLQK